MLTVQHLLVITNLKKRKFVWHLFLANWEVNNERLSRRNISSKNLKLLKNILPSNQNFFETTIVNSAILQLNKLPAFKGRMNMVKGESKNSYDNCTPHLLSNEKGKFLVFNCILWTAMYWSCSWGRFKGTKKELGGPRWLLWMGVLGGIYICFYLLCMPNLN